MSTTDWPDLLIQWYHTHARELPWRSDPRPYDVWISEIMLQQTQVDTVIPYFHRFRESFPAVEDLAAADLGDVLKQWEGLGYYSRARNLHKAAGVVVDLHNGSLPDTFCELRKLPGFGPYTAAAVASIAFGEPVPVVDGNVLRVFTRLFGDYDDVTQQKVKRSVFERLQPVIATVAPSDFNQGMMELGALICRPRQPICAECPLQKSCVAYRDGLTAALPVKSKRKPRPHYDVAVGVVWNDDKVLIGRRPAGGMLGGLWEFPGGKHTSAESAADFVAQKVAAETGVRVTPEQMYCTVSHGYTHFQITLTAWKCRYTGGGLEPNTHDKLQWVSWEKIDQYPFPKTALQVIAAVNE